MILKAKLRIRSSKNPENIEFKKGLGVGVLVEQEVEFDSNKFSGEQGKAIALIGFSSSFIEKYIEVHYEEIEAFSDELTESEMPKEILSQNQKVALEKLWFIFGNDGKYSNLSHHKFIQQIYQYNDLDIEKLRKHYKMSKLNSCYLIVKGILSTD